MGLDGADAAEAEVAAEVEVDVGALFVSEEAVKALMEMAGSGSTCDAAGDAEARFESEEAVKALIESAGSVSASDAEAEAKTEGGGTIDCGGGAFHLPTQLTLRISPILRTHSRSGALAHARAVARAAPLITALTAPL